MNAVDVIIKKRDGLELNREEIEFLVNGFTRGDIPDYQAAAWAMAVLIRGMTDRETTDLTLAMANSGAAAGSVGSRRHLPAQPGRPERRIVGGRMSTRKSTMRRGPRSSSKPLAGAL